MSNDNITPKSDKDAGCVIAEMIKRGEHRTYSYPQNGLPDVKHSAPAWSPFFDAPRSPKESTKTANAAGGCVIAEMIERGERRTYSYPQNGLPDIKHSAPAWSPFFDAPRSPKE